MVEDFCEKNDGILNFYNMDGYFCADLWVKTDKN